MAGIFTRTDPVDGRAAAKPYNFVRPITASASRIDSTNKGEVEQIKKRASLSEWQQEAWDYVDAIGEVKYAFNLVGNVTSRCRIFPATVKDLGETPSAVKEDDPDLPEGIYDAAVRAMRRLESTTGGQAALLREAAINLSVTGECYLVQQPAEPAGGKPESWDIKSVDEVQVDSSSKVVLRPSPTAGVNESTKLPEKAFIGRIWRAHPRYGALADSSMRGLLDLMNELLLLNRAFRATARSRLNAGLLYIPDGIAAAGDVDSEPVYDPDTGTTTGDPEEAQDEIEDALLESMTTPITDESSAAAIVPIILRGPAEAAEAIKLIKFERSFDQNLAQRADRVLERILLGLDVPKDVVTGLAQVRYSNAIRIDENLYKAHIEPLVVLICDALTYIYLRPSLKAAGFDDEAVNKLVVWYDPSEIVTRPDRAEDANEGHDRHAISNDAWRKAHGFSSEDAPSKEEIVLRMMIEKGDLLPELSEALMAWWAPQVMEQVRRANQDTGGSTLPQEIQDVLLPEDGTAAPASNGTAPIDSTGLDAILNPQPPAPAPVPEGATP